MSNESAVQEVFDTILKGINVTLQIHSRKNFDSFRVMLHNKLKAYKTSMDSIGYLDPKVESSSLSAKFDAKRNLGVFALQATRQRVAYTIVSEEPSESN